MELVTDLEKSSVLDLLEDEPVEPPPQPQEPVTPSLSSHVVLHVEDNETNFRLVERIL